MEAGGGEIVGVEEFAARGAGSPDRDGRCVGFLRFVETADQSGDHVGVFRVVVIAGAVEVGRHGGVVEESVLGAVVLAHLEAGDFRNGVGLVGDFER